MSSEFFSTFVYYYTVTIVHLTHFVVAICPLTVLCLLMIKRTAFTDGACRGTNPGNRCAAAWAYFEDGVLIDDYAWTLDGMYTNNQAEYFALVGLLEYLLGAQILEVVIHCDSKLVVSQVNGLWQVRDALVEPCYYAQSLMRVGGHTLVHVKGHVGIEGNELCDELCNEILDEAEAKEKATA